MQERRKLERFDLHAPTKIEVVGTRGRKDVLTLTTKDISSAGAFIETQEPLPEGMPVKMELLLTLEMIKRLVGVKGKARVRVKGKVIRIADDGMAIEFDGRYKILAENGAS